MGNHTSLVKIFVVGLVTIVLAASLAYADPPPEEVWNVMYHTSGPYSDTARDIAVDEAGQVYVSGYSILFQPTRWSTIQYDAGGNSQWIKYYDRNEYDRAFGIAADGAGFVYEAGTAAYNFYGVPRNGDYLLIKYDAANGDAVWIRTYDIDQNDVATGVGLDDTSFIYITGYTGLQDTTVWPPVGGPYDFCTVKYNSEGDRLWVRKYNSGWDDRAFGVAVDEEGSVYVAGATYRTATGYDYLTIKYDPDGNQIWKSSYISFDDNWASDIAVSKDGYIYVTGRSGSEEEGFNYLTVKYDGEGNRLWDRIYDNGGDDRAEGIAVDESGYIYVTGCSHNGVNYDYCTVKYDSDGDIRWEKLYDSQVDDFADGIAVDSEGFVYVTGYASDAFRTIKYRQILGIDEEIPVRVDPMLSLDAAPGGSITIRYQLTSPCKVSLSIYDALGRKVAILVDAQKPVGEHEHSWMPDGAGVYFIRLQAGASQTTRKFVSLR